MHIDDNSKFLLYIEPKQKATADVNDEYTTLMQKALDEARSGASNYNDKGNREHFTEGHAFKGVHHCTGCGLTGGNKDYLLKNGLITNVLSVHYLKNHRSEISANQWKKINELKEFYNKKSFSADGSKSYLPTAGEFKFVLYAGAILGIIAFFAYGFYIYKTKIEKV